MVWERERGRRSKGKRMDAMCMVGWHRVRLERAASVCMMVGTFLSKDGGKGAACKWWRLHRWGTTRGGRSGGVMPWFAGSRGRKGSVYESL